VSSRASPDLDIYRARFLLIAAMDAQGCGYFEIGKPAGFAMLPPSPRRMVRLEPMLGRQASNKP